MNAYYYGLWKKMREWMEENGAKKAYYTIEEWAAEIKEPTLTPAKMGYMYRLGLVNKQQNRQYYGDSKNRYEPILNL